MKYEVRTPLRDITVEVDGELGVTKGAWKGKSLQELYAIACARGWLIRPSKSRKSS